MSHKLVNKTSQARRLWKQWILSVTLGELVGFAVPSAAGGMVAAWGISGIAKIALLSVAGIGEGAILGGSQWLVLRRYLPALKWQAWVLATALAAGIAWVIGMSLGTATSYLSGLNPVLLGIVAMPLGVLLLLSLGTAQWLVLRRYIPASSSWIAVNALAWSLGVAVPVIALALVPDGAPPLLMVVVGLISGVLMGAVVGAITGITLVRLLYNAGIAGSKPS